MLIFKPNWHARILRNAEPEVHVTVIEGQETAPVVPVQIAAAEVLEAAQQLVTLNQRQDDPAIMEAVNRLHSRFDALENRLDSMSGQLSEVATAATVAAVGALETPTTAEVIEEIVEELPTTPIPQETAPVVPEAPAKRKRSWI